MVQGCNPHNSSANKIPISHASDTNLEDRIRNIAKTDKTLSDKTLSCQIIFPPYSFVRAKVEGRKGFVNKRYKIDHSNLPSNHIRERCQIEQYRVTVLSVCTKANDEMEEKNKEENKGKHKDDDGYEDLFSFSVVLPDKGRK